MPLKPAAPVKDEALTAEQLAAEVNVPVGTLYYWRHIGRGPKGFKVEGSVRYRRSEINRWLRESGDTALVG